MQVKKQQLEPDLFHIRNGECQDCMLSPCLFNLYAEYIMQNARLDEAQARIKIAGRNINNLRYAYDTTLTAKKQRTKETLDENERGVKMLALNPTFKKLRSCHLLPSLHGR